MGTPTSGGPALCWPNDPRRLTQLRSWWSFVGGRGRIYRELSKRATEGATPARTDHDRKELEQLYLMSIRRNLKLLVVLTGGPMEGRQSYREQIFAALPNVPFHGNAVVEHFRDVHIRMRAHTAARVGVGWDKGFEVVTAAAQNWRRGV